MPDPRDLTTLAAVRNFRAVGDGENTEEDPAIADMITAASVTILNHPDFGRQFISAGNDDQAIAFSHYAGRFLDLAPYDLRELTSITVDGDELDVNAYGLRPMPPREGVYTYVRFAQRYGPDPEREVVITGKWGFEAIPPDVAHWCKVTVVAWLDRDVASVERTFSIDEGRLERPEALPSAVVAGLSAYRRKNVSVGL